jgi:hypothetical protein
MSDLSSFTEQAQSVLFNTLGAFFAYSSKQFEEGKKEGVDYVTVCSGLLAPRVHAQALVDGLHEINERGVAMDIKENGIPAIIKRELFNHECFYTGNIEDCVDKLVDYNIERKQIQDIYADLYPTVEL